MSIQTKYGISRRSEAHIGIVLVSRSVEAQHKGARFCVRVHPHYKRTGENEQSLKGKEWQGEWNIISPSHFYIVYKAEFDRRLPKLVVLRNRISVCNAPSPFLSCVERDSPRTGSSRLRNSAQIHRSGVLDFTCTRKRTQSNLSHDHHIIFRKLKITPWIPCLIENNKLSASVL